MPQPSDYNTLKQRLERAEAVIRAIQRGEIDAVVLKEQVSLIRPESELRKTEADLQANRLNFQTLFDSIEDFLFIVTTDGLIRHFNPMVEHILGYDPATLHNTHIHQLSAENNQNTANNKHAPLKFPECFLTSDNKIIHVETRMTPGVWSGEDVYFCLSRDVTERKMYESELNRLNQELQALNEQLEQRVKERTYQLNEARKLAESANHAKSEFLANMSHELRTPLNGILGYTQILMRDTNLSENQNNALSVMHRSGEHLLMLINDILDLSKIEAQKMILHEEVVFLDAFLDNVVEIIRIRAENKNIAFSYTKSDDLPSAIMADDKRLRQILLNLLGNAVKFTPKGNVWFDISKRNDQICFSIKDTGIGIPEAHQKEIFHSFRQIDSSIARTEGTGLGLAISKRLIHLMNSELHLTSQPDKGSTFWFCVSFPEIDKQPSVSKNNESISLSSIDGKPYKILIVDDEPYNRLMLKDMLMPYGFQLIEAIDGADALEKAIEHIPHVILLDIVMPRMNGYDACTQIRKIPLLKDVIVIAVTASVVGEARKKCFDATCNDIIDKPVHMDELLSKLVDYLKIDVKQAEKNTQTANPSEMILPSADILEKLKALAVKGDILRIKKHAKQLVEKPDTTQFGNKLLALANAFKVNEIKELVGNG
ncbi:MAG: cache sensor hybrid histidine kinase [Candidatus Magnetoglobus multicellularis str. Araruama]|uniref:histidine kinase n=1 Tax=Candidatus Magnetoglobus multicellularis str. Araruama TaxID=890399 RepID=A0A1V1PDA4_9BACT|nr:MAG: cache sensor hybrid histidine kinase [Candidatus Magnetoglobus multicellularis str. Araruama]